MLRAFDRVREELMSPGGEHSPLRVVEMNLARLRGQMEAQRKLYERLEALAERVRPRVVAFLGLSAYRASRRAGHDLLETYRATDDAITEHYEGAGVDELSDGLALVAEVREALHVREHQLPTAHAQRVYLRSALA